MKTRGSCVMSLALTTLIILSSVVTVTEGKCSGRWAIHACWGGNGKRSGIPATVDDDSTSNALNLLRRLLLGKQPPSPLLSSLDDPPVPASLRPQDLLSLSSPDSSSLSSVGYGERFPRQEDLQEPVLPSGNRLASLRRILRTMQQIDDDFL